jgi:type I restriction enzyme M protein
VAGWVKASPRHNLLKADRYADPEDRDEYTAENVFWVPKEARYY